MLEYWNIGFIGQECAAYLHTTCCDPHVVDRYLEAFFLQSLVYIDLNMVRAGAGYLGEVSVLENHIPVFLSRP